MTSETYRAATTDARDVARSANAGVLARVPVSCRDRRPVQTGTAGSSSAARSSTALSSRSVAGISQSLCGSSETACLAPKRRRARYRDAVVTWTDDVDEILVSDLAAGFAYLTPASGVVISPMAPLALRDREAGTVTVTTSQAMWKKLDRIRRNSGVAIAYHAREYGLIGQVRIRACPGPGELPDLPRPRLA